MKRTLSALAIGALLAASLTACTYPSKHTSAGTVLAASSEQSTEAGSPAGAATGKQSTKPTTPTFGDTFAWPDGLTVTLGPLVEFVPSEYAAGAVDGQENICFEITVANGTDKTVESFGILVTAVSGGREASHVFDSANGIDMPTADILPGESLTWTEAFSVLNPDHVRVNIDDVLDFNRDSVNFTN